MELSKSIPAIGYMKAVKQYAASRGLPFFTVQDMLIARRLYEAHAAINN